MRFDRNATALAIVLALSAAPLLARPQYEYRGPDECAPCHSQKAEEWSGSLHALAHTEPLYDRYFIQASQETDGAVEPFCAGCHTPVAVLNGTIPFEQPPQGPADTVLRNPAENTGVNCEFCHRIEGAEEIRNARFRLVDKDTMHGPFDDADSMGAHGTQYSEFHTTSEFCGTCHSVDHPTNGIHLELTYREWKESPWAAEGVQCQDCHMSDRIGPRVDRPGQASDVGPERPHISLHAFRGPNLLFVDEPGRELIKRLSEDLIRSAAEIAVGEIEQTEDGPVLPVLVTNTGAGHYLPTGITELREAWIELTVTDADGNEVMHSGRLREDGAIEPGSVVYTTLVRDAEGTITTKFWNTVEKVSDRRLPPRETVTERFPLPAGAPTTGLHVTVALRYRSVSPFGLGEVHAEPGELTVPLVTFATAERDL